MKTFGKSHLGWSVVLAVVLAGGGLFAQVIDEDFEFGPPAELSLIGDAQVLDDGCGNQVLSLTQGINNQGGWAWFDQQFDLNEGRVEIEFDLFIGRGTTTPPADGVSVIFQFDGDLLATGDAGGGLGVGNFRGTASPYVAVGFDIWDNGAVDIETACDGVHGAQSTCQVEVNQNIDPENVASQIAVQGPDYIASGDLYGTPANPAAGSCLPEDLIHVEIVFDNRLMVVALQGGLGSDGAPFPRTEVISYATEPFPDRVSNIGFAASTGSANAYQWIDNLLVREDESSVTFEAEEPLSSGAINCGGPEVDATAEVGLSFRQDGLFGEEVSRTGDIETGITITTSGFGRVELGAENNTTIARPIDVSQIPGAGAQVEQVLQSNSWSTIGVEYHARVEPGKYDVTLYFSEDFAPSVNLFGQSSKLFDVYIGDEQVLCNWSQASAAGSPTGSGDPNALCAGVLDTAVARTFTVNVPDEGDGAGLLRVLVDDLGGGLPPENAALNALSFERVGAADGSPAAGDLECVGVEEGTAPAGLLIEEDFEEATEGECPPGMICQKLGTGTYTARVETEPILLEKRLRLVNETNDVQTTAVFEQCVDVLDHTLTAEFDVYMSWPDGIVPADGGSFFVVQAPDAALVTPGTGGGGYLGIPRDVYGFAVEFDTYGLCCGNNDPSGVGVVGAPYVHVGINNMSADSTITHVQYNPELIPVAEGGIGWPNWRDPAGVHVTVTYNAGRVTVELEGITENIEEFGPVIVAEASVPPVFAGQAIVGFSGGTGGLNQVLEVDNVEITAEECEPPDPSDSPALAALEDARQRWQADGELYINCGGPVLFCNSSQFPAPAASGDADTGDGVVWVADQAVGSDPAEGEFFTVTPLDNHSGSSNDLEVETTDMGNFDAAGTEPGIDDNDRIFHDQRIRDVQYDIPVANGTHEVTLYFANAQSVTAGSGRRFFRVVVEGELQSGFEHCEFSGRPALGDPIDNRAFGFDTLFDPVDAAERLYAPAAPGACNWPSCPNPTVVSGANPDPDRDQILDVDECGNAAVVALRYEVSVSDGALTIALTDPDRDVDEPRSPNANPTIAGLAIKASGGGGGERFVRGDPNSDGSINLTDGIVILNFLFLGQAPPACMDAADVDDDGGARPTLTDSIRFFNWLFTGGPPPSSPSPSAANYAPADCGEDPSDDEMDCATPSGKCS